MGGLAEERWCGIASRWGLGICRGALSSTSESYGVIDMEVNVEMIMTSAVVCAKADYNVDDLMQIMDKDSVRCIPIIDNDGRCVGVVSGSDLVRWHKLRKRSSEVPVSQILSEPVVAVAPNLTVMEAAKLMVEKNVYHLVVVEEGQMVGILSVMDILKQVALDSVLDQ
tara:strand:+ start:364 stop:867 length:504 start_codon:yes stop_codon:yes gene_type:complete